MTNESDAKIPVIAKTADKHSMIYWHAGRIRQRRRRRERERERDQQMDRWKDKQEKLKTEKNRLNKKK